MGGTFPNFLHGFSVALQPHNLLWSLVGVLIGNAAGVLPGLGVMATLSILLNLPCHASHAVTCLDGCPTTRAGRGGVALGITMLAAAFGVVQMILFAPFLMSVAFRFGPAEACASMLLGLLAGATLARGSALKGTAMTLLGLLLGTVGGAGLLRHRRVPQEREHHRRRGHDGHDDPHPRPAAPPGGPEGGRLPHPARHAGRQAAPAASAAARSPGWPAPRRPPIPRCRATLSPP